MTFYVAGLHVPTSGAPTFCAVEVRFAALPVENAAHCLKPFWWSSGVKWSIGTGRPRGWGLALATASAGLQIA
tara:strand:+ start:210 stop:428 length:219 start_codon:yes stop_codon:yes gene_type:complete